MWKTLRIVTLKVLSKYPNSYGDLGSTTPGTSLYSLRANWESDDSTKQIKKKTTITRVYTPEKLTWHLKMDPCLQKEIGKHHFGVSMLGLGGAITTRQFFGKKTYIGNCQINFIHLYKVCPYQL